MFNNKTFSLVDSWWIRLGQPWLGLFVVFVDILFAFITPLSTQGFKWVLANCHGNPKERWRATLNLHTFYIGIHILHTVFFTFPIVFTRRICLAIKSFFDWSSLIFLWALHVIQAWYLKEKLEASYSERLASYPKGSGNTQSWSGHATESS